MRKVLLFISLFITTLSQAQLNQWTWMSGDNTPQDEFTSTYPRSREAAVGWADKEGNLFMFGGGYDKDHREHRFRNDLWKYDIKTNVWTLIKDGDDFGYFGEKGVANAYNVPPARRDAVSWTDNEGNFWMFGGNGNADPWEDVLNDLWKFDPTTLMWTWMGGFEGGYVDGMPVYGAKGEFSPEYWPGATENGAGWADAQGNFWLLGGAYGMYYFWKYDTKTNMWAMMGNQAPYSGQAMSGKSIDGFLWLYYSNSIWKYDIQNDVWINLGSKTPSYGIKGEANTFNWPPLRHNTHFWIDKEGMFWMLGGGIKNDYSFYPKYGLAEYLYNDLWMYNPTTHQWTWMGGDNTINQPGVYGTLGETAPENKPGARMDGLSWVDNLGNLWLYGGNGDFDIDEESPYGYPGNYSNEYYTDAWKYTMQLSEITLSCPAPVTVNTEPRTCAAVVQNIDPVLSPAGMEAIVNYTLTGATVGSGTGSASGLSFNKGVTTVTYTLAGDPARWCSLTVTVNDGEAPQLSAIQTSTASLWPANHKMVDVTLGYSSSDNCGVTKTEVKVTSNEPQNGLGDGDTDIDWQVVNNNKVQLRAERSAKGDGRTYTITVTVWDAAGNPTSRSTTVLVPKNMGGGNNGKGITVSAGSGLEESADDLGLKVLSNPSASYFTLIVQSKEKAPLTLRILDASGRPVEAKNKLANNSSLSIGHQYRPGIYFAELVQGSKKVTVKLVKQP